jgi:hypothetical protein
MTRAEMIVELQGVLGILADRVDWDTISDASLRRDVEGFRRARAETAEIQAEIDADRAAGIK